MTVVIFPSMHSFVYVEKEKVKGGDFFEVIPIYEMVSLSVIVR